MPIISESVISRFLHRNWARSATKERAPAKDHRRATFCIPVDSPRFSTEYRRPATTKQMATTMRFVSASFKMQNPIRAVSTGFRTIMGCTCERS